MYCRYDFYQTATSVSVSIYLKNLSRDDVSVTIGERSVSHSLRDSLPSIPMHMLTQTHRRLQLSVQAKPANAHVPATLVIDPLFAPVSKETSSFSVFSTKVEVVLAKSDPSINWTRLDAPSLAPAPTPAPAPAPAPTPVANTAAPRPRSKWDSLNLDDEDKPDENADINAFFQRIYADADPDTKRAMLKSYQESGGTTLSTDWSKVGKGTVETKPPEGVEAKKW